jgi:threonine 3-dehydrogenase
LANHSARVSAAKQGLGQYGFSAASMRFICASARVHNALEGFAAEVNDYRFDLAKMAAGGIVNVARESLDQPVRQLGMRDSLDLGLEKSGIPGVFQAMLTAMNHGGKIALLSISPDQMGLDRS